MGIDNLIIIEKRNCIGCGECVKVCPNVFKLDSEDIVSFVQDDAYPLKENNGAVKKINNAINLCPTASISWKK